MGGEERGGEAWDGRWVGARRGGREGEGGEEGWVGAPFVKS